MAVLELYTDQAGLCLPLLALKDTTLLHLTHGIWNAPYQGS